VIIGYSFFAGDLFHVGHLYQLEQNKKHCNYLIAGLLTNEAIASYKRWPIIPLDERVRIFRALKVVDLVVVQEKRDPTSTLQALYDLGIKVDVLMHADDWSKETDPDMRNAMNWVESHGGKLVQPPYWLEGPTTTKIINQIKEGEKTG
jgi:cytidyltransferase-like protein